MTVNERLTALRIAMKASGLAAYIVPSSDPHQGEYVAAHWKAREWISGFTGSAGTVVVTLDHAGLWTDSRYFLQAEEQLKGSSVELHKLNIPHTPEHLEWMQENLPSGSKAGLDGRLFSVGQVRHLAKKFHPKNIDLDTTSGLISDIWTDRPPLPQHPVFELEVKYAGASRGQKIQAVRGKMEKADYHLVSTLDDIAWLFNLRGGDVPCTPVFYAYAVVATDAAFLFIEESKVPADLKGKLNKDGVIVMPYTSIELFLKNIPTGKIISVDLASTSNQVFNAIDSEKIKEGTNITSSLKAIKNPVEIQHFKEVMRIDAVALVQLYRWLDETLVKRPVPESEVAVRLNEFRQAQGGYFGESFDAIAGYNSNGAIVHYHAEPGTCANIKPEGMLLLDSGGQYLNGTTDITRTIALSKPSVEQKRDFTLVLKGHIALGNVKFPQGTTGVQLDILARMYLWQNGLNYGHGTGHGVGFFNNVHEGPQGISPTAGTPKASVTIEPGMVTSNEPGLYRAGQYGIRTENLVLCVEDEENDFGKFYRFKTLTLFPIDLNLVDEGLLSDDEKAWINSYHEKVFASVSPLLNEAEKAWLKEKCGKI
ncbi:MAG: aminopeptidase P family protein [Saprospiraceae bacterium]|nr:MAG: aminopeptidase P family protein [Saprospiraceae bacterium]